MWDIHNGRCVRLLVGCGDGVNVVRVSPSGKTAAVQISLVLSTFGI